MHIIVNAYLQKPSNVYMYMYTYTCTCTYAHHMPTLCMCTCTLHCNISTHVHVHVHVHVRVCIADCAQGFPQSMLSELIGTTTQYSTCTCTWLLE